MDMRECRIVRCFDQGSHHLRLPTSMKLLRKACDDDDATNLTNADGYETITSMKLHAWNMHILPLATNVIFARRPDFLT